MSKITKPPNRSLVRVQQSLELILLREILPNTKREKIPTNRSQNRPRRNLKATATNVVRLVIGFLTVVLQERTKSTSWKRWKM